MTAPRYPVLARHSADFPWTEVMAQLRAIWLDGPEIDGKPRTSRMLAELLETQDTSVAAWCSHSKSRRKPPEWAVARMLHLTDRQLTFNGERILITEVPAAEPAEAT